MFHPVNEDHTPSSSIFMRWAVESNLGPRGLRSHHFSFYTFMSEKNMYISCLTQ